MSGTEWVVCAFFGGIGIGYLGAIVAMWLDDWEQALSPWDKPDPDDWEGA